MCFGCILNGKVKAKGDRAKFTFAVLPLMTRPDAVLEDLGPQLQKTVLSPEKTIIVEKVEDYHFNNG